MCRQTGNSINNPIVDQKMKSYASLYGADIYKIKLQKNPLLKTVGVVIWTNDEPRIMKKYRVHHIYLLRRRILYKAIVKSLI